jgi:F420H(2)-dependent quinone reductase
MMTRERSTGQDEPAAGGHRRSALWARRGSRPALDALVPGADGGGMGDGEQDPTPNQHASDAGSMTVEPKRVPIPRWMVRSAWVIHRALFSVTGGRLGLRNPTADRYGLMRVRTVGRRTGEERIAILGYFEDGPDLVTMAMNGWADPEPAWWLNLQARPDATVELADGSRAIHARAADKDERPRLWARWAHYDKDLDRYAALRSRETQVVILEPRPAQQPGDRESS